MSRAANDNFSPAMQAGLEAVRRMALEARRKPVGWPRRSGVGEPTRKRSRRFYGLPGRS